MEITSIDDSKETKALEPTNKKELFFFFNFRLIIIRSIPLMQKKIPLFDPHSAHVYCVCVDKSNDNYTDMCQVMIDTEVETNLGLFIHNTVQQTIVNKL